MNSTDFITVTEPGFDASKYATIQAAAIQERINHFPNGRLYLEIGGKFITDYHAQRVLPGFEPHCKPAIINSLKIPFSAIFCVNAQDLMDGRMLSNKDISYQDYTLKMIEELIPKINGRIDVSITLIDEANRQYAEDFAELINSQFGIKTYRRYKISGYPHAETILTDDGYGKDEYVPHDGSLILVTGAASNSGKMGTCLSQLYLDSKQGIDSGYAKYELFPIWNLPLNHPVNLAYEAATVDIGDYNLEDPFHKSAYGISAINYNRDVAAFPIIQNICTSIVSKSNYMQTYKSPTDMGLNNAGYAITNEPVVLRAAREEIARRTEWTMQQVEQGKGEKTWIDTIRLIAKRADEFHS